jgi:hypothetical protein
MVETPPTPLQPTNYSGKIYLFVGIVNVLILILVAILYATGNFFTTKINLFVIAMFLVDAIVIYVYRAHKGEEMKIRKIAGIEAVDEAVGRATEMGKSVLFIPGIQDMDDVQTIAGLTILGSIARLTAEYETRLDVPVSKSLVMAVGRETVREAYYAVGRPDEYSDDIVHYITDEQFGYVAALDGIMVRDKPATCIYMGAFFAESLILAETGNSIGAIQVAGTAMPTQIPFFFVACDYTLIGEELFAAQAYLSKDLRLIGSLKGQDVGKMLSMIAICVVAVVATVAAVTQIGFLDTITEYLKKVFILNF